MGRIDLDRLSADWFDNQDPERAVFDATAALTRLRTVGDDVSKALPLLEHGIEPVCDGPDGDPRLAYEAALAAEGAFRDTENRSGLRTPEQLDLRSRSQLVIARAGYRAGFEKQAFVRVLALLTWIVEEPLEGRGALLAALGSSVPNSGAAAGVRALGLYPAALRRAPYGQAKVARFLGIARPFVAAYLQPGGRGSLPVLYDRTHALASQWLYALLEAAPDDQLVPLLVELERASRPTNARGRATEPLRDFELARLAGDAAEAERQRLEAQVRLTSFPLDRHLRTVERHGYLAA